MFTFLLWTVILCKYKNIEAEFMLVTFVFLLIDIIGLCVLGDYLSK